MLTDTGEAKVNAAPPRYFLLFSDAFERRVRLSAESKILAFTFERFRLYRLKTLFENRLKFHFNVLFFIQCISRQASPNNKLLSYREFLHCLITIFHKVN